MSESSAERHGHVQIEDDRSVSVAFLVAVVFVVEGLLTSVWLTIQSIPNGHQDSRISIAAMLSVPRTYLSRVDVPSRSHMTRGEVSDSKPSLRWPWKSLQVIRAYAGPPCCTTGISGQ